MSQLNHSKTIFNQPPELTETEMQAKRNQREEERKRDYRIWIDAMPDQEREDYFYVFGE